MGRVFCRSFISCSVLLVKAADCAIMLLLHWMLIINPLTMRWNLGKLSVMWEYTLSIDWVYLGSTKFRGPVYQILQIYLQLEHSYQIWDYLYLIFLEPVPIDSHLCYIMPVSIVGNVYSLCRLWYVLQYFSDKCNRWRLHQKQAVADGVYMKRQKHGKVLLMYLGSWLLLFLIFLLAFHTF